MIASVETDVFALDLAPAAKLGRDSLFLSPAYALFCPPASKTQQKSWPLQNFGDSRGTKMKRRKLRYLFTISY